jgi:hypothetical protein
LLLSRREAKKLAALHKDHVTGIDDRVGATRQGSCG